MLTLVLLFLTQTAPPPASTPAHDKTFWRGVIQNLYAPPAGVPLPALVQELSGYLASPDPELRDDIAYSVLTAWIYRQPIVSPELRRSLMGEWLTNLSRGIGSQGTDAVLRRSFSALSLGMLVALDNEAPYLERAEFDRLLAAALTYLKDERDVRGFEPGKGWMHSAAHTADLLKFLGRSRHLQPAQQAAILTAILDKMSRTDTVFTHGEDERLARAVLSIAARPDFDEAGFRRWAAGFTPARSTAEPTPASLASAQNRKNLAVSLLAVLSTDTRELASVQSARAIVIAALKTFM